MLKSRGGRMRRPLRYAATMVAALWLTMWGAGQANATIFWYGVTPANMASGACIYEWGPTPQTCDTTVDQQWDLVTDYYDSNGHAHVEIRSSDTGYCIGVTADQGPYQIRYSRQLDMEGCSGWGNSAQDWTMITERPSTSNGYQHFIGFYNAAAGVCMDGGFGQVYGFPAQCNPNNNWQVWDIWH